MRRFDDGPHVRDRRVQFVVDNKKVELVQGRHFLLSVGQARLNGFGVIRPPIFQTLDQNIP